jgi:ribonuclease HI
VNQALAHFTERALTKRKNKLPTVALFLDFSKAFDVGNRQRMVADLIEAGLPAHFVNYVRNYMTDRRFEVEVRSWKRVVKGGSRRSVAGFVQGSVLGPVLWSLYIDPLLRKLGSQIPGLCAEDLIVYADDLTILCSGRTHSEAEKLANSVCEVVRGWSRERNLKVNTGKSKALKVFWGEDKGGEPGIRFGGEQLEVVKSFKLLGVWVDERIGFRTHCGWVKGEVDKRARAVRALAGGKWGVSPGSVRALYKGVVEAKVLHGLPIWGALARKTDLGDVDKAMKRGIRPILGLPSRAKDEVLFHLSDVPNLNDLLTKSAVMEVERAMRGPETTLKRMLVSVDGRGEGVTESKGKRGGGKLLLHYLVATWRSFFPAAAFEQEGGARGARLSDYPSLGKVAFRAATAEDEEAVQRRIREVKADYVCYTDASVIGGGRFRKATSTGAYVIRDREGLELVNAAFDLPTASTSYKAEKSTLTTALHAMADLSGVKGKRVIIFTDAQSVLVRAQKFALDSTSDVELATALSRLSDVAEVYVEHVRGHSDISGNVEVDRRAGEGGVRREVSGGARFIYSSQEAKLHVKSILRKRRELELAGMVNFSESARIYVESGGLDTGRVRLLKVDEPRWTTLHVARALAGFPPGQSIKPGWARGDRCEFCGEHVKDSAVHAFMKCPAHADSREELIKKLKSEQCFLFSSKAAPELFEYVKEAFCVNGKWEERSKIVEEGLGEGGSAEDDEEVSWRGGTFELDVFEEDETIQASEAGQAGDDN